MSRSNSSPFSRRNLLRGLGAGAALLAPFARTQVSTAAASAAGNLLVFFTPNGFDRDKFGAASPGSNYAFLPSLAGLNGDRADITLIKGLCNKSASAKSSHEDCVKILACVSGSELYRGYGPSIDHVVAEHHGGRPMTLAVEDFNDEPNWQTKISWVSDNAFDPHVKSPRAVFDNVFGSFMPPGMSTPSTEPAMPTPTHAQNRSVLDFVRQDISLFKSRLSAADRAKLDLHMESLREVEKRVAAVGGGTDAVPSTAVCSLENLQSRAYASGGSDEITSLQAQGETMVDLVSTSFACGLKHASTLFWQPASAGINPNGGGGNHHQVTHYEAPNSGEQRPKIDTWYAERFKYTLDALRSRGVLDSTVVVWATEISEQHDQNNFVMLVAGGKSLGLKLGQYIEYPFHGDEGGLVGTGRDSKNRSQADLWVSVQKALGIPSDTFGDPEYSNGGLSELWSPA